MHKEDATAFFLSWVYQLSKNRLQPFFFFFVVLLIFFFKILAKGYSYKNLNQDLKHQI